MSGLFYIFHADKGVVLSAIASSISLIMTESHQERWVIDSNTGNPLEIDWR